MSLMDLLSNQLWREAEEPFNEGSVHHYLLEICFVYHCILSEIGNEN